MWSICGEVRSSATVYYYNIHMYIMSYHSRFETPRDGHSLEGRSLAAGVVQL